MAMRHHEGVVAIPAAPEEVFAFVDDHSRFSSHMNQSSWMMGGGRMSVKLDAAKGQAVGSHLRLGGRILGMRLFVDEVVMRRNPPTDKVWETVGTPSLLVIGRYTMGIEISPENNGCRLRVFIDFELPSGWVTHWLGLLIGGAYAKWCVNQMLAGASTRFAGREWVRAA